MAVRIVGSFCKGNISTRWLVMQNLQAVAAACIELSFIFILV